MKRKLIGLLLAAVLLVAAVDAWLWFGKKRQPNGSAANKTSAGEQTATLAPVPVRVAYAFIGDLVLRVSATGRTRARRAVTIIPYTSGLLMEVRVRDGQRVRRGEVLFRLDDRQARLNVREARNEVMQAEVEYGLMRQEASSSGDSLVQADRNNSPFRMSAAGFRRIERLYRAGKVSEAEYERARIDYEIAQIFSGSRRDELMAVKSGLAAALAKLRRAELELEYTTIRAPFSGTVGQVRVSPGQWVGPSQELCRLVDLEHLYFDAEVLESEIGLVHPGAGAQVHFPAYPDTVFTGRVVGINPVLNEKSRTYTVVVDLPNPEGKLLDGMYGEVKLEAQILPHRLLVPRRAVIERDRRKLVFIVRKNAEGQDVAQWCYITPGRENDQFVEVLDSAFGLKPGEPVVVEGHFTLSHDAPVRIVGSGGK